MGTIETFDHTADVGLRVRASDWNDLFRTAAEGVFDYIVVNRDDVLVRNRESIALEGEDLNDLLALWLNELIFRSETQHRLYTQFEVKVNENARHLEAEIGGEPIDRDRHVLDHEVKAVTRHALSVAWDGAQWVAELILDI